MTEQSFGIIPVQKINGEFWYLLICDHNDNWSFPKGHKEKDELVRESALRELREETGINEIVLLNDTELKEHYVYTLHGKKIFKTVTFFLGQVFNPETTIQEKEIKDCLWLPYDQALRQLSFKQGRELLKQAHEFLLTNKKALS